VSRLQDGHPQNLARLFTIGDGDFPEQVWEARDLGAMLRHQLGVNLRSDLPAAAAAAQLAEAAQSSIQTFGSLLNHAHPPIELLKLVKDFAKSGRVTQDGPLQAEVATVLYFAAIAVALVRHGARISGLDASALGEGFAWALGQAWLDDGTRAVLRQASNAV
jgi:hypothetical protein